MMGKRQQKEKNKNKLQRYPHKGKIINRTDRIRNNKSIKQRTRQKTRINNNNIHTEGKKWAEQP